ncbi:MAG: PAS domain S-box protein [Deltaproteobacteria bacterium]|nr:PAS domain S-box protein [Deltaproteobacteria bacterium]
MAQKPDYEDLGEKITELRKKPLGAGSAEKALHAMEERYRRLIEAVTDYVFTVRLKYGQPVETIHAPSCISVTGYSPEDFVSDPYLWLMMVHEEDRLKIQEYTRQILSGQDLPPIEHRIIRKDGVVRWVSNTTLLHRDPQGNLVSYDGLVRDITKRKHAEEALVRSEKRYRIIFESTGTATIISDEDMTILMANSEFESLSGFLRGEVEGKKRWTEFVAKEDMESLKEYHRSRHIDPNLVPGKHEFRFIDRKGNVRNILATVSIIPETKDGVASFMDITDLKQAEEERALRQKLEGVLEMAGAACHELNQPLTTITGYSELLMDGMDEKTSIYEKLKIIHEAVRHLGQITRKIMNINKYETIDYVNAKIIDIDKASRDD